MVTSLPPKGADWHYLQCDINVFSPQYKNFPNIKLFYVVNHDPFKIAFDVSDEEYKDDEETELLYPSYRFDRYLAEQGKRQTMRKHLEEMAEWPSGISSDI